MGSRLGLAAGVVLAAAALAIGLAAGPTGGEDERAGRLDRLSAVAPSVRSDAAFVEHLRESQHAP